MGLCALSLNSYFYFFYFFFVVLCFDICLRKTTKNKINDIIREMHLFVHSVFDKIKYI